jgi:hypothetical protein
MRISPRDMKIKIYKTIIISIVCKGCKTWLLTLVEDHSGLSMLENRVLRRINIPKREEDGEHNGQHFTLHSKT